VFETVYRRGLVLPRVSAGGLLLAFALAAVLATAVGVSAWSFARASGQSPAQVAALRHAAYEQGVQVGSRQATASAVAHARTVALASGRKLGYRRGLKVGFARGKAVGEQLGRTVGYTAGYAAGAASAAPSKKKKH
jgi:hypothetical protein